MQYIAGNANSGINSYETQLDCCITEFGNGKEGAPECLAVLLSPPPVPIDGSGLWYPDYDNGWYNGICINKMPVPYGIEAFTSELACCENGM